MKSIEYKSRNTQLNIMSTIDELLYIYAIIQSGDSTKMVVEVSDYLNKTYGIKDSYAITKYTLEQLSKDMSRILEKYGYYKNTEEINFYEKGKH